jgi:hypothetical protein
MIWFKWIKNNWKYYFVQWINSIKSWFEAIFLRYNIRHLYDIIEADNDG